MKSFIFRNKVRKINRAVKIRIYPNAEQRVQIEKTIGCSRFIYNCMLADKMEHYKKEKKMLRNTPASYKKEYPWLKEVDSLALANVQMHLESAFHKFFREPSAGFPRFKSKKSSRKSYTTNVVNGNIFLEGKYLKLPKMTAVRMKLHRPISEKWKLKSVTVSREPSGKYFASLTESFDAVCVEDLNLKGMAGGLHLGKGVHDNGYGLFLSMLEYKLEERGKYLIKADRYFASSKICSVCGNKKEELSLSDRIYYCECGNRMDRDVNAAVNIMKEGKRIFAECA
nr:RNA-guided endonuclease TnpB family protein [Blautia obeum]